MFSKIEIWVDKFVVNLWQRKLYLATLHAFIICRVCSAFFYAYPGFGLHVELQFFVQDGFTNLEALQTATLNPAVFTGKLHDYGTIEESKFASLVIFEQQSVREYSNTQDINSVFLKGHYLSRHKLDSLMKVQETLYYYSNQHVGLWTPLQFTNHVKGFCSFDAIFDYLKLSSAICPWRR